MVALLNHKQIEGLKATGKREKLRIGDGLFLSMSATGKKTWLTKFRHNGKLIEKSLGRFPDVKLARARELVKSIQEVVTNGGDADSVLNATPTDTFERYFIEWFKTKTTGPKPLSAEYSRQARRRFERYVLPVIGHKSIPEITPQECLGVVQKIENKGHIETARRVKDHMTKVFDFAKFDGVSGNPMAGINVRLKARPKTKNMPYLAPDQMANFFRNLKAERGLEAQTKTLIEITIRTMVRTNEIRDGKWSELSDKFWTIPAERMKMDRDHLVPIMPQVAELFETQRSICNDPDQWGAHRGTNLKPKEDDMCAISENGMLFALYRMGYKGVATMHGFRSTASTYLYGTKRHRGRAIEFQLAHVEKNKVKGAYNRFDYLDERIAIMRDWNDWLDRQKMKGELLV